MSTSELDHRTTDPSLSDKEFMRRLRARFIERGSEGADAVVDAVTVGEWRECFENEPEEAADEEMSYWTDDGDV